VRHDDIASQVDYLFWVRDRILAAAAALSEDEFRSGETVATRDLRATLVHQLENEWAWRSRLSESAFPVDGLKAEDYATLEEFVGHWHAEERLLRAWFGDLSDAQLAALPPGEANVLPLWRYLMYVVTHGIQQFSEAALLLSRLGHSPGEIGFLAFCSNASP
jgi:uncharacterized damage-inducible protein DinB